MRLAFNNFKKSFLYIKNPKTFKRNFGNTDSFSQILQKTNCKFTNSIIDCVVFLTILYLIEKCNEFL